MKHLRFALAVLVLTLVWAFAVTQRTYAVYNGGIVRVNEAKGDGTYRLVVGFTGNAGETEVRRETTITGSTTAASLRQWGIAQVADLAGAKTLANAAALQPLQTFDLTPVSQPALTAFQTWSAKVVKYRAWKDVGLSNSTAVSDLNALKADIDATYVAGYVTQ